MRCYLILSIASLTVQANPWFFNLFKPQTPTPSTPTYQPSIAPTAEHYYTLHSFLVGYIAKNDVLTSKWLRAAFHDLQNFGANWGTSGGPNGCLKDEPVASQAQNVQLRGPVSELAKVVSTSFPNIAFPFGDVLSLAGKVAAEHAYPCIQIKWRPGRPPCGPEVEAGPFPEIQTRAEFQPFLSRYNFTATEFGVLLAGSHGLKTAKVIINGIPFAWVPDTKNSGVAFIQGTLNAPWAVSEPSIFKRPATPMNHWFASFGFVRLPVEFMFFPSAVAKVTNFFLYFKSSLVRVDSSFLPTENYLRALASAGETAFNQRFADVMAKMLEIGVKPTDRMGDWIRVGGQGYCPGGIYQSNIANIP